MKTLKQIQQDSFDVTDDKSLKSLKVIEDENGVFRVETKIVEKMDTVPITLNIL